MCASYEVTKKTTCMPSYLWGWVVLPPDSGYLLPAGSGSGYLVKTKLFFNSVLVT